jgi:hypothetical protein
MLVRPEPEQVVDAHEAVVERIAREHRVLRRTARRWFVELVRFLDACDEAALPLAPSKKVDRAWHEFVLHTRDYAAFCEERYGRFLHHDPYERPDKGAYERTWVALRQRGDGRPDRRIWPDPFGRTAYGPGGGGGGGVGVGADGSDGGASCGGGGCGGGGG